MRIFGKLAQQRRSASGRARDRTFLFTTKKAFRVSRFQTGILAIYLKRLGQSFFGVLTDRSTGQSVACRCHLASSLLGNDRRHGGEGREFSLLPVRKASQREESVPDSSLWLALESLFIRHLTRTKWIYVCLPVGVLIRITRGAGFQLLKTRFFVG